jgi:hypothetical protein
MTISRFCWSAPVAQLVAVLSDFSVWISKRMLIRVILPAPVSGSASFAYQDRAAEFRPQWGSFPGLRGEHAICSRERDHRQPVTFATPFVHASHPNGDGARSVQAKGSRDNLCPLMLLCKKNG